MTVLLKFPRLEKAVKLVIAEPPLEAGTVHVTVAWALPAVAVPIVGAPGIVNGVTELEAADAVLDPTKFLALTVNVYGVPFVRPITVAVRIFPTTVAVMLPGLEVTV
jgi:hypothetical protein